MRTIIIVEDEMLIARDLKRRLEQWNYRVVDMVRTGFDAVSKVIEKGPDLVLMDVHLKGDMDGIEASSIISRKCDASIVHVTANADDATMERIHGTRSHGLIIKPFCDAEILTVVERALLLRGMEGSSTITS